MTWLDHIVAVPTIGARVRPNYALLNPERVGEFVATLPDGENARAELSASDMKFRTSDGVRIVVQPTDVAVEFQYGVSEEKVPGELSRMNVPDVQPYSSLRMLVNERFCSLVEYLAPRLGTPLHTSRIGLLTKVTLLKDDAPPGLQDYLGHIQTYWNESDVVATESRNVVVLNRDDLGKFLDRCHHTLKFDFDESEEINLNLDWQRVYDEPLELDGSSVGEVVSDLSTTAERYFEEFAEGMQR